MERYGEFNQVSSSYNFTMPNAANPTAEVAANTHGGPVHITGISSMATRQLLAQLTRSFTKRSGHCVAIESVGGVDAARRVQAGEAFDLVILASDAIDKLIAAGAVVTGSRVDLVRSGVAVAVRAGEALPDIASEEAVKCAVLAAQSIGCSTGPSGAAVAKLFEHWGITGHIKSRMVQAPPGVPVATLVASGEVALGFQQLSELLHVDGISVVGALPAAIQITTIFSAGVPVQRGTYSARTAAVKSLLDFMVSPDAVAAKRRHGMEPCQ